jgi:protein-S-isoprenylcysteine O-methyltransferase Ste14
MSINTSVQQQHNSGKSNLAAAIRKRMLQILFQFLLMAALLFIPSGRLDWVWAWVYLGAFVGGVVINALILLPRSPELIAERGQQKENTKGWDKRLTPFISAFMLGLWLVAGLDNRLDWSPQYALTVNLIALTCAVAGSLLFSWAMASNKFFSTTVRIQGDRGHAVASNGPYRIVRHPGYVGAIVSSLAAPLLLGSLWALLPAGVLVLLIIVRTALEDRTLQAELDGYKDYARRVRYRLLPGVW